MIAIRMYLGCLKISKKQLSSIWKQRKHISWYMIIRMVCLPVWVFYICSYLFPSFAIWVFALIAAPTAMTAIAFSHLVKWNTTLTAAITLWTSIISIITFPLLTRILIGENIDINSIDMLRSLMKRILFPLLLAQITRPWLEENNIWYQSYIWPATIFLIMPLIWWPIWIHLDTYINMWWQTLLIWTALLSLFSILLHILWWHMYTWASHEDKIAWSLGMWYINLVIALLIANTYFWAEAVLVVLLYELPRDLMIIPFAWVSKKLDS